VSASPASETAVQMDFDRPAALPGVAVGRLATRGHLFRVVAPSFVTVLHLEGDSRWTMRGARFRSVPGTIDLKVPGELYLEEARAGAARLHTLGFADHLVEEARAALSRPAAPPTDNALDAKDPRVRAIHRLHLRLLDPRAVGLAADAAALEQDLCAALAEVVELSSEPRGGPPTPRAAGLAPVRRARAMLDERWAETVSLDELAAHARLDKFRLCRAFRDEIGLPPHAYVTHRRVSMAMKMLAHGEGQAEVAAKVGLYDQSQLHRHFKRIVGVTPGAYARAVR
jgi:AraC-like DNA-binding protein